MTTTQKVAGVMTSALVVLTSRGAKGETTVASNWTTQSKDSLVTVQTNGSTVTVTLPDQFAIMSSAVVEPHPSTGGS